MPVIPAEIRNNIIQQYEAKGLSWLQDEIKTHDPVYYATGEIQNPQRLMRALEIRLATGFRLKNYRKAKGYPDFDIIKYGIDISKEKLHNNINTRVDKMIEDGLIEEVRSLIPVPSF